MTANLLTLNSSETEFLLIGLPQQLAKINTSSLITTHSDRNLGFMFDEHLTFSDQISALSTNLAIIIFVNFAVFVLILTSKLPVPSLLLSFILNLTTATHCLQSQIKRLQNIQNLLARAVTRTPKSSRITSVLKSLHWLKINERIKYKLLSVTC